MKRRVFAAIDIPDIARQAAVEHTSVLRAEFPYSKVRWERPEKLHITVKFAGPLDEAQLALFAERVNVAAQSAIPFRLAVTGTGAFIKRRGPTVLWLGIEQLPGDSDPLTNIAKLLAGESDARVFHPHITIARAKVPENVKDLIEKHRSCNFGPIDFEVKELVIYESVLSSSGSVYSKLAEFPLSGR